MYARFVPPAAGESAAASSGAQHGDHLPDQTNAHATVLVNDKSSKKSKRKRPVQDSTIESTDRKTKKPKTTEPAAEPKNDQVNQVKTKKNKQDKRAKVEKEEKKKEKGEKKNKPNENNDREQITSKPHTDLDGDVDVTEVDVAEPEKKKAKREKKKKPTKPVEEDGEGEVAEQNEVHKTVLKRLSKSLRLASEAAARQATEEPRKEEKVELHGLEPLPQPAMPRDEEVKLTYETLPPWLSAPMRVAQSTRTSFTSVGIPAKTAEVLQSKGYADAFAVQTAAIPLLLPNSTSRPGDLLISAATGSGKTLAYALPIVNDISQGAVTRLRALVVLPTRELVRQAQDVFELCAKAYDGSDRKRVRIGIAVGSRSLKTEQEALLDRESRYDPETYEKISQETRQRLGLLAASAEASSTDEGEVDEEDRDPRLGQWDGQVVDFTSTVDVLICTPGRLVEHMEQTPGFDLDYVRWLVVDEADKLLAQSFQGWLDTALARLQVSRFGARDFPDSPHSGVRKVVLSATLTRDLSLLGRLALRRPQLIVLDADSAVASDGKTEEAVAEHTLPELLREFATRVHDANLKPLYLLELLRGGLMKKAEGTPADAESITSSSDSDSDSTSDDSDDSDSDSSSDTDSDTTSSDSDSDSDSESSSGSNSPPTPKTPTATAPELPMALIFTKSNESALRLARLLTLLDPSTTPHIGTLTSTTPTSTRRKILRAFSATNNNDRPTTTTAAASAALRLVIASDLVARGVDIPNLAHVVNYDLPPSLAGYVHRVGRTARAGRPGCAWTLVADPESGWFWGKIAKGAGVRRATAVERARIDEMPDGRVREYEDALERLGREAHEQRRFGEGRERRK